MIDLNIKGGCYCISEFLTDMKEMKKGHIVNISSINEKSATSELAVYGGTKQFWAGMSDALRKELVGTGVKVTNILPGVCNTPMITRAAEHRMGMSKKEAEELGSKLIQPEDVGLMVWEAVCKPERCYVRDICMVDMMFTVWGRLTAGVGRLVQAGGTGVRSGEKTGDTAAICRLGEKTGHADGAAGQAAGVR